jgi:hypothetical protein
MPFTVVWLPAALRQLAALWNASADRNALTRAADRFDRLLRFDPGTKGVDYYGDRLLVEPPLQVVFRVRPDDMLVEVLQVW